MKKLLFFTILLFNYSVFAKEYYVSTNGNDKSNGLTESTAWRTISFASRSGYLKPGDIVWIKAGNYGNENVVIKYQGTISKPISFIGYKDKPGDIEVMYYSYLKGRKLDPNEMPLLDGKNRASGLKGISLDKSKHIIVKNIQIKNYRWGVHGGNVSNSLVKGVLAINFGDINSTAASGYGAQFGKGGSNKFEDCIFINATGANFRIEGDNNIVDNVKSYADDNSTGHISATDYYIHLNGGNNNIIRNSYAERVGNLKHTGHGIGLKYNCENNLIENCEIVNIAQSIELRHSGVRNNLVKNLLIRGNQGSITLRDGANNNIIENSIVKNTNRGIYIFDQTEDGQGGLVASKNLIKNTIFINVGTFIESMKSKKVSKIGYISDNKIINCTIDGAKNVFNSELIMDSSNEILNSVFINIEKYQPKNAKYTSNWKNINNNYINNGFEPLKGNNNLSYDPNFIDKSKNNYRLKSTSKLIDAGKNSIEVKQDFDGNDRPQGKSHDIGAFEFKNKTTSLFKADAGNDVVICLGESHTLTASKGSSYQWSNGETTRSVKVNPSSTKTYSVTVTLGDESDSDQVKVTVNNVEANAGEDKTILIGESVKLTAQGGDSYLWSNGNTTKSITVNPKSTTNYLVKVTNGECEDEDEVKVTVKSKITNPNPAKAFAGDDISLCLGENVTLYGTGGDSYEWSTGEAKSSITVNPKRTTTYVLSATRGGVTNSDSVTVTVENCNVSGSENKVNEPSIYPNPTNGILNIKLNNISNQLNLQLINLNGRIVYTDKMNSGNGNESKKLDLSKFAKGVYFVRLFNSNQNMVKKILVI